MKSFLHKYDIRTMSRRKQFLLCIAFFVVFAGIAAVILIFHFFDEKETTEYVNHTVTTVKMTQTLTAAGKATAGKTEVVKMTAGKVYKAASVEVNQHVNEGQPLAYYSDGTHTDASCEGIVTEIVAPENGKTTDSTHYVKIRNTKYMYLKVTLPENEINSVEKGNAAEIVINAYPNKRYQGEIIAKNDVSTTMVSEDENAGEDSDTSGDDASDESEDSDSEDNESEDSDSEDDEDSEEVSLDDEEESSGDEEEDVFGENSSSSYYSVEIRFPNDGKVKPGMSANCIITISDRDHVLAVPIEAVYFDKSDNAYVKVVKGNDVVNRTVELGESDSNNVEIRGGLNKGQVIRKVQLQ